MSTANLRRACIFLGDEDRAAIERIRRRLQLNSDGLAVRQAIRSLAKRLEASQAAPGTDKEQKK